MTEQKSPIRTWRMASYQPTDGLKKKKAVREPVAPPEAPAEKRLSSSLRRL